MIMYNANIYQNQLWDEITVLFMLSTSFQVSRALYNRHIVLALFQRGVQEELKEIQKLTQMNYVVQPSLISKS